MSQAQSSQPEAADDEIIPRSLENTGVAKILDSHNRRSALEANAEEKITLTIDAVQSALGEIFEGDSAERIHASYSIEPWRRAAKIAEEDSTRFVCTSSSKPDPINDKLLIVINLDTAMVSAIAAQHFGMNAFAKPGELGSVERHLARYAAQTVSNAILVAITNDPPAATPKASSTKIGDIAVSPIDNLESFPLFNENDDCITMSLKRGERGSENLANMSIVLPASLFVQTKTKNEDAAPPEKIDLESISRDASCELSAELARITMSVKSLMSLKAGVDLDLPMASISNIAIRQKDFEYPLFNGALVESAGMRSVVIQSASD